MIKLVLHKSDGKYDITKLVTSITWSGDYKSCSRKLEFSILANSNDKKIPKIDIPLSGLVILYNDDKELFRGFIFERELSSSGTTIDYLAFDYSERLNKIKVSYNIKDLTPTQIMNKFLDDYGLKKGSIATSNVKVKKVFIGVTAYDMLMTGYTEQAKNDSKKYMIRSIEDKFEAVEKGNIKLKVAFEEGKNIISSSFKESISNMVNKVLIVDDKGNKKSEVVDSDMLKIHGLFQDIYKTEEGKDSQVEAKALLKGVEKTCSLSGFGDTTCITGMGVQVKDSYTGLIGHFYIDSDTHKWEGNKYTIDLDLNLKNIMNEVSAGSDEQENNSSSNSSSDSSNSSSSNNSSNSGGGKGSELVAKAKTKLGKPYVWGATGENSFDCSGLTMWAHKQCGISIPRVSRDQASKGTSVSRNNLQPGDLVFFDTMGKGYVSHVGMYVGDGKMIHAPKTGDVVKIVSIETSYYKSKYKGARRYY